MPQPEPGFQVRFFYFRDAQRQPLVTVCMVRREDGAVGYGWAVCGPADRPRYGDTGAYAGSMAWRREHGILGGRTIAYGRADAALRRGTQIADGVWRYARPILRAEAIETIVRCGANALLTLAWDNSPNAFPKHMQPGAHHDAS